MNLALEVEIFEIGGVPPFFALSSYPKDPEKFLRATGWPEMSAKTDLPRWKEERRKKERRKKNVT